VWVTRDLKFVESDFPGKSLKAPVKAPFTHPLHSQILNPYVPPGYIPPPVQAPAHWNPVPMYPWISGTPHYVPFPAAMPFAQPVPSSLPSVNDPIIPPISPSESEVSTSLSPPTATDSSPGDQPVDDSTEVTDSTPIQNPEQAACPNSDKKSSHPMQLHPRGLLGIYSAMLESFTAHTSLDEA
jgi:hypothetical protein